MFTRINKRTQGEGGFTLIELLVVIIIIAILAAIAIPMYLSQREKGWEANAKSDLRNAAVAQESYYTEAQTYTDDLGLLDVEGFTPSSNITFTFGTVDTVGYCMEAVHISGGDMWILDSTTGEPEEVAGCP